MHFYSFTFICTFNTQKWKKLRKTLTKALKSCVFSLVFYYHVQILSRNNQSMENPEVALERDTYDINKWRKTFTKKRTNHIKKELYGWNLHNYWKGSRSIHHRTLIKHCLRYKQCGKIFSLCSWYSVSFRAKEKILSEKQEGELIKLFYLSEKKRCRSNASLSSKS